MFNKTLRTALLGSGAAFAMMAGPAFAGQAEDLKAQIDSLQSRLDSIEKQQATVPATQAAAPADAVVGGDFPGSFKLPGSDTSMAIHGYTKLDFIYDFDANLGDTFNSTGIPGNNTANSHADGAVRLHARQSRLTFETRTPTNYGPLNTFIQTDFFGNQGNPRNNSSSLMRLRHAYGSLGPVLAGQTWSNFSDTDDEAETLDFSGPQGGASARQGQVRYTHDMGKWRLSAAVENSSAALHSFTITTGSSTTGAVASVTNTNGLFGSQGNTNAGMTRMPDITGRVQYTDTWGHLSLSGVIRKFDVTNGGAASNTVGGTTEFRDDTIGGGGTLGGTFNFGQWIGGAFAKDQIGFTGIYGYGIDRYFQTGSGPNMDGAVTGLGTTAERIRLFENYGGFVWVLHNWTDQLRTNVAYGVMANGIPGSVPVTVSTGATGGGNTQFTKVQTIHANLIWSPVKAVNIGLEFMYGTRDFRSLPAGVVQPGGNTGDAKRLMASLQYVF